ncbi:Pseudouridylate synthase, 23S RNA-specific [Roseovarius mucosus DSM 17069]|uniref:Pseudouridylate synthase, 23S RNA-specific n=1 Tax=Roseovarius mucosus DSM 17069 TaxID=1288298 RepID=A0A0A0HL54_9RHOB|nr:Pseudouridylate synthase, 23S RNA-specific [Roseovarius mucosus DSM 17069]
MSGVQTRVVGPDEGDQRLDRWIRRLFPHVGQVQIEKMCRKGELRVDGGRVKPATRLEVGQSVRVPPLPDVDERPTGALARISPADAKMIQSCVIYRDDHIIALNKPPGLPVQGGSKQLRHVDGLAEALRFGAEDKPRLVHRLDKDTSGVLLLARTREAAKGLTAAFRHRNTRKIYWAAVAGVPTPRMGTIRFGLVKAPGHGAKGEGEKMLCLHPRDIDATPGGQARDHRLCRDRGGGRAHGVDGADPGDGADTSAARAYGRDRASHRRRWQIWRIRAGEPWRWLGRAAGR